MELVEKYDIALSSIFGTKKIDAIAEAETEEEIESIVFEMMQELIKENKNI